MPQIIKLPELVNYQKELMNFVDDPSTRFISFLKARQVGGSFFNKILVTKWALSEQNQKIGYLTPTLKLSKLFFKELSESLKPFIKNENKTDLIIEFKTGSYCQFFSAESKDSIRGFQFHYVILDEVAYMNTDDINLIIRPTWMIVGKKIIFTSTPNGNQGFFYDQCQLALNDEPGYKIKTATIYDNPFIKIEDIEVIKRQIPERVWQQEYLGLFVNGSGTVFTNINKCIFNIKYIQGEDTYAAIDWAKQNDYTVVTIMNSKRQVIDIYRINTVEYILQVKFIIEFLKKYNPKIVLSEENNIGTVVNEILKRDYKGQIKTITLDNTLKKTIIENLIVGFESEDILIPDNEILKRELQAFSCTYNTQTQTIKYSAPTGLHDDMVISLAYVYWLVKQMAKSSHAIPQRR